MSIAPDIEATLTVLPTAHGGPTTAFVSGARPQFYYQGQDHGCQITIPNDRTLNPGETSQALFTFLNPEDHWGKLVIGTPFLLRHGQKVVAYGSVSNLLQLEQSAKRILGGAGQPLPRNAAT